MRHCVQRNRDKDNRKSLIRNNASEKEVNSIFKVLKEKYYQP